MISPRLAMRTLALPLLIAACSPVVPNDTTQTSYPPPPPSTMVGPTDLSALNSPMVQGSPLDGSTDPTAPLPQSVINAVNAAPDDDPDAPGSAVEVAGPKVPLAQSDRATPELLTGAPSPNNPAATTPPPPRSGSGTETASTGTTASGTTATTTTTTATVAPKPATAPSTSTSTSGGASSSSSSSGGGIIGYANTTRNRVGEKVYARSGAGDKDAFYRACAAYRSQDQAQQDFLNSGGPQRDPKGVDPDGDGFACYWDPAPYRSAKSGG